MLEKPTPPPIEARMMLVGRSASKLLKIEYFMRQYPTLSEGISKLVEQCEADRRFEGSSKGSA